MNLFVSELYIYPLKSGRDIVRQSLTLDRFGGEQDRRWMLVDGDGVFVTQRKHPRMAQLAVTLTARGIRCSHLSVPEELVVEYPSSNAPMPEVSVWQDRCQALDAGDAAASWFSEVLGIPVRLVYMPESSRRRVDPTYAANGETVSFADGFPLLLTTQGSLNDLNQRLKTPLSMRRFRPNLVIDGSPAYAEDQWRRIRIGSVDLVVAKACERCIMTTIDPDTGKAGKEPLATLASYRRRNNKVLFGQNLIHQGQGTITVGDRVEILE